MTSAKRKKKQKLPLRAALKGALLSIAVSLVLILLLTLLLYLGWLDESAIPIGNTVIKILAAIACGLAVMLGKHRGNWIAGGIAAACAQLLSWAGMSLYLGAFTPSWNLLADLLLSFAVAAAAAGVLTKLQKT